MHPIIRLVAHLGASPARPCHPVGCVAAESDALVAGHTGAVAALGPSRGGGRGTSCGSWVAVGAAAYRSVKETDSKEQIDLIPTQTLGYHKDTWCHG